MESRESQTSGFDIDVVKNGLDNLRYQLAKFNLSHQGLNLDLSAQHSGIKHMHDNMMNLAKHYTSLMDTLYQVQDKIDNNRKEIQNLDNQYEVLSEEREQLQKEQKELFTEEKFQEINEKLSEGKASIAKDDLEIELRLRDFAREDLFQRMDAYNNVKERLDNINVEFRTEWESYKTEIREFRQELKPYRDDLEDLNNIIVSRLRGLGIHGQNLAAEDKEAIERTIKYYQLEKEFKERQEKYLDSQIILRDLQGEMAGLMVERQALWKQNEKLELEIDQLQPEGQKTGFLLHHAERHTDLVQTDNEFQEDNFGDDNQEFTDTEEFREDNHCGGLMLHRCMKMTNIPLVMKTTQYVNSEAVSTDLCDGEDKDIQQEQEDVERETMSGKTNHDQKANIGPTQGDKDPDEDAEDEEDEEGEETYTILDSTLMSMLPKGFGAQPGDSDDDEKEENEDGEDEPNDASGGTNVQQQTSKAQRFHAMADAPDSPTSLISKVRGRLGAPSTSSKNILESRGITAATNPLTKQSSAKFGESTFSVTRRSRRK